MLCMGEEGYLAAARRIMNTADTIRAGINHNTRDQDYGQIHFLDSMTSEVVDIYLVNDYLTMKGWRMNGCQNPPGFHFCVTLSNTLPGVAEQFVEDLRRSRIRQKSAVPSGEKRRAVWAGRLPGGRENS